MRLGLGIGLNRRIGGGEPAPGPTNTVLPVVSGDPTIGQVLSCTTGTWTGNGTITYAYQWTRDGANIGGATVSTYTLVSGDNSKVITCRVTATDLDGSRSATARGIPVFDVVSLGDSTVSSYLGTTAVLDFTQTISRKQQLADPSDTIAQQKTVFVSSGLGANVRWAIIQVGLNDLDPAEAASVAIARLQDLVDTVAAAVQPNGGKVFISQMIPVRARLITIYGGTDGPIAYQKWLDMNAAMAGTGPNPITGVDGRITAHVALMNDGAGNLLPAYDTGDGIHPNNAGRQVNANAWIDAIISAGLQNTLPPTAVAQITGVPTISGSQTENATLTATPATVTSFPVSTRTWRWARDGVDISGATGLTYTLVTADVGAVITVRQIETNVLGVSTATSAATGVIQPPSSFTPADLFLASEVGLWGDVTISKVWQDTARTTPVTAPGDPVASWELNTASGVVYATQATSGNRPLYQEDTGVGYLDFDGTDDCLSVSSLNLTGADKLTAIVALQKDNDAQTIILEHSANVSSNAGTFFLVNGGGLGAGPSYNGTSRGTATAVLSQGSTTANSFAAVRKDVVTSLHDISGDSTSLRVNGTASGTPGTADKGAGNFTTQNFFIGARNNASVRFNGRIYGLIVRGALTSGTDLTDAEAWADALINP